MCGRFSLSAPPEALREFFRMVSVPEIRPRYNIAPTTPVAVVRQPTPGGEREMTLLRWGLVPAWAKELSIGAKMINARSETAAQKPSFRSAMRARRCLVAADGYYEWRSEAGGKQPYFFRLPGGPPLAFAGLWERWEKSGDGPIETCAILTTEANSQVAAYHNRMPVILAPAEFDAWLDPAQTRAEPLLPLLRPWQGEALEIYPVTRAVNKATFDGPECNEKVG